VQRIKGWVGEKKRYQLTYSTYLLRVARAQRRSRRPEVPQQQLQLDHRFSTILAQQPDNACQATERLEFSFPAQKRIQEVQLQLEFLMTTRQARRMMVQVCMGSCTHAQKQSWHGRNWRESRVPAFLNTGGAWQSQARGRGKRVEFIRNRRMQGSKTTWPAVGIWWNWIIISSYNTWEALLLLYWVVIVALKYSGIILLTMLLRSLPLIASILLEFFAHFCLYPTMWKLWIF